MAASSDTARLGATSRKRQHDKMRTSLVFNPTPSMPCMYSSPSIHPQVCTQRSWKRPYGVGLLVSGVDATGPHLYNTCPSGNYYEYKAMAIGARSQVRGGNGRASGCATEALNRTPLSPPCGCCQHGSRHGVTA